MCQGWNERDIQKENTISIYFEYNLSIPIILKACETSGFFTHYNYFNQCVGSASIWFGSMFG